MVNKKYIAIYLFLALLPIIILAIEYPSLPEMVAVRNNGVSPDDFENKIQLWFLPILTILLAIFGMFTPKLGSKKLMTVSVGLAEKVFVFVLFMFDFAFAIELSMAKGILANINLGLIVLVICILPIVFISVLGLILVKGKN